MRLSKSGAMTSFWSFFRPMRRHGSHGTRARPDRARAQGLRQGFPAKGAGNQMAGWRTPAREQRETGLGKRARQSAAGVVPKFHAAIDHDIARAGDVAHAGACLVVEQPAAVELEGRSARHAHGSETNIAGRSAVADLQLACADDRVLIGIFAAENLDSDSELFEMDAASAVIVLHDSPLELVVVCRIDRDRAVAGAAPVGSKIPESGE